MISIRAGHSRRALAIQRPAIALARGARTGLLMIRIAAAVGFQELPPGLPGAPGCEIDVRILEDLPDCGRRELVPEAVQLAWCASIPAWVGAGHLQHQRADGLRRGGRPRVRRG